MSVGPSGRLTVSVERSTPRACLRLIGPIVPDLLVMRTQLYETGVKRVEFGTPQGVTTAHGVELLCDRVLPFLK